MAYSFYGGRQGRTYHLVAHYDSIYDMVMLFQQGGSYTDANYNEYVIIDTPNKGDRENGIIYRRGLNYQEEFALTDKTTISKNEEVEVTLYGEPGITYSTTSNNNHALPPAAGTLSIVTKVPKYFEYSYTLSTDTNGITNIELSTINELKPASVNNKDISLFEHDFMLFCTNPGGGAEYVGQIVGPQGETPAITVQDWTTFLTNPDIDKDFVKAIRRPGVELDDNGNVKKDTFVDDIQYGYCNIRDEYGNITSGILAFDLPYTVFKVNAKSVSPYGGDGYEAHNNNGNWSYEKLISENDESIEHPFFKSYDIKVPIGIHGKNIKSIGLNISDEDQLRDPTTGDIIQSEDKHNYQFYYIQTNFDNKGEGEDSEPQYIDGAWLREVDRVTDDGEFGDETITNPPTLEALKEKLPDLERNYTYKAGDKVKNINLSASDILVAIQGGTTSTNAISIPESAVIGTEIEDGSVIWRVVQYQRQPASEITVHYTHGNDDKIKLKLLSDLQEDKDGRVYAKYTNIDERALIGEIKDIVGVGFDDTDKRTQRLFIQYNTFKRNAYGDPIIDTEYKYDQDGNIIGWPTTDSEGHQRQYLDKAIQFITEFRVDPNTQEVYAVYNTTKEDQKLGNLKAITKVYWNDDFNLVIEYNTKKDDQLETSVLRDFRMKYVDQMFIENEKDLSQEKRWVADYVVGRDATADDGYRHDKKYISSRLNDIVDVQLYGDNLIVLWSDPTKRNNLKEGHYYDVVWDGDGKEYRWENLGPILASEHIYGNFTSLDDLKTQYPYGLDRDLNGNQLNQNAQQAGWVVTISDENGYKLYAYDYLKNERGGWYEIQNLAADAVDPRYSLIVERSNINDPNRPSNNDSVLNPLGYWFVVSE